MTFTRFLTIFLAASLCSFGHCADATTKTWKKHCSNCHGKDGLGKTALGKALKITDLTSKEFQKTRNPDVIRQQILKGSKDDKGIIRMIPYETLLEEAEIDALVDFIMNLPSK